MTMVNAFLWLQLYLDLCLKLSAWSKGWHSAAPGAVLQLSYEL